MAERKYGYDGYKCLADSLGASMREGTIERDGLDSTPIIRPMKRFTPTAIRKAVGQVQGGSSLLERYPRINIEMHLSARKPFVRVDFRMWEGPNKAGDKDLPALCAVLLEVFGTYAEALAGNQWGISIHFSDKYYQDAGVERKESLSTVLDRLYKKHNVGGIKITWVDGSSKGHRIKVEGVELLDEDDWSLFIEDVKREFGEESFDKAKQDGEITGIGYRSVGPGLTNHRIFLKGVKGRYYLN